MSDIKSFHNNCSVIREIKIGIPVTTMLYFYIQVMQTIELGHRSEKETYNDMLRISLVSGLHTPRNSCSKFDMRATPDPTIYKQNKMCHVRNGALHSKAGIRINNPLHVAFYSDPHNC